MSAEERRKILQMVSDGKINAEEAATLMRALDDPAGDDVQPEADPWSEKLNAAEFDEVRKRARRFAMIPLWTGVALTILTAWWMYLIQRSAGLNFWFFCMSMPFMLGVLLIALGAGSKFSHWIYVNVDRTNQHDGPRHITIALPLPLGLVGWFIRNFGAHIQGLKNTSVDEILDALSLAKSITEPLIVNVDERHKGGERVQVFIG
jgi:hypothetical protein